MVTSNNGVLLWGSSMLRAYGRYKFSPDVALVGVTVLKKSDYASVVH